jgi:hypothetical protein
MLVVDMFLGVQYACLVTGCSTLCVQGYMKAAESSEEDMVAALSGIYSNRAVGKELQMDVDTHGPTQASMQEVCCLCHLDALG